MSNAPIIDQNTKIEQIREGYGNIAENGLSCCGTKDFLNSGGGCCGTSDEGWSVDDLAEKIGYSKEDLEKLPEGTNMGLSCGNPLIIAGLKPGQVVVDLGSGGGFDCFLAGPKVGETGRVIGVDMTPNMITKARNNIEGYTKQYGLDNVEFRLGEIESLPVADASVDVVISNCVINLSTDKARVWKEISRVLKPGGIVAASDMALLKPLPEGVRDMVNALVGCVSGAVLIEEYEAMIKSACMGDVHIKPKPEYVKTLLGFNDPLYNKIQEELPEGTTPADFVTSIDVLAIKPTGKCCC